MEVHHLRFFHLSVSLTFYLTAVVPLLTFAYHVDVVAAHPTAHPVVVTGTISEYEDEEDDEEEEDEEEEDEEEGTNFSRQHEC